MFTSKRKTTENPETPPGSNSIIGAGAIITGSIESVGDIRIDGTLKGNLQGKAKILIGPEGMVEGDITGNTADILGKVKGSIRMKGLLHLHGKAEIDGDIHAGKLQMAATVSFNGQCSMGANVVDLHAGMQAVVNE